MGKDLETAVIAVLFFNVYFFIFFKLSVICSFVMKKRPQRHFVGKNSNKFVCNAFSSAAQSIRNAKNGSVASASERSMVRRDLTLAK